MTDAVSTNAVVPPKGGILAAAFEKYQAAPKGKSDFVLVAFYQDPRVKRIVESNVRNFSVPDLKEEVWQRLAEIFWQKLLPALLSNPNEADNVYKVVFAGARHVCMSVRKEKSRDEIRHVSTDEPDDDMIAVVEDQVQSEDFTERVNSQIDQERAGQQLRRRLLMTSTDHHIFPLVQIVDAAPAPLTTKKRVKAPAPDGAAARELAEIRAKLGITNNAFADRLGIVLPTLSSYLYNRVQKVPDRVMDAARALLTQGPTDFDRAARIFGDATKMSEIISRWDKVLGLEGNTEADNNIAFVLKVDPITVWRWRTDASKPDVADIAAFDRKVNRFAALQADPG